MNATVTRLPTAPTTYTGAQLALIKRTVAADTNGPEFDLFVEVARRAGLDPFRKQIMALVFSKNDPNKRRMSIITGIDGLRAIADRSGQYSPDEEEPDFTYDEALKAPTTNPLGLVRARVRIWKSGKPVTGIAYWDEYAPLREKWAENETGRRAPTGTFELDTSGQWGKMGRTMLAKCAEANALRKAFPEDTSGLYEGAELDRAQVVDLTASEIIEGFAESERVARIGGPGITMQFSPNQPLESVPLGKMADRIIEAVNGYGGAKMLAWFESANTHPLREFWAHSPGEALEVKKVVEARRAALAETETAE